MLTETDQKPDNGNSRMIRIDYLANHKSTIPMWADCFWSEWYIFYLRSRRSRDDVRQSVAERCNTDSLPLAIVALDDGVPVGTGSLKTNDLVERTDLSPWLAGIFVVPAARRRGIGSMIVRHLENEAARLGHRQLYLWTPTAERLYASLGWQPLEYTAHLGERITIMEKSLLLE